MEKEQVIEKLEEVFEVACSRYVALKGTSSSNTLSDIREMGDLLLSAKTNERREMEKMSGYITREVKKAISIQIDGITIAEKIVRGSVKP